MENPGAGGTPLEDQAARGVTAGELVGEDQDTFQGEPTRPESQPGGNGAGPTQAHPPGSTGAAGSSAGPAKHGPGWKGEKRPPEQHQKQWQTRRRKARERSRPDFSDLGGAGAAADPEEERLEAEFLEWKKRQGEKPVEKIDYDQMAGFIFDTGTGALATLFQDDGWKPRVGKIKIPAQNGQPEQLVDFNERDIPVKAIANYMRVKEWPDLPPGVMLACVLVAYSAQRLRSPNTAERVKGIWQWIRSKFARKRKAAPPAEPVIVPERDRKAA